MRQPRLTIRNYAIGSKRGKFLEAVGYYHRYLLGPLIEVLRIRYTPLTVDYGVVHISDHLPGALVSELGDLFKVGTVEEISEKVVRASEIFEETARYLKSESAD